MVRRCSPIVAAALCFSGCQCDRKGDGSLVTSQGVPQIVAQVNFGNVQVGQSVHLTVPLADTGTGPLNVVTQTVSGAPFSEPTPFKGGIAPGGHTSAVLAFAPTQAGPATGTLTLVDDGDPSQVTVALVGNGLDLNLTVSPASLNFGNVPVGLSPSPSQTVTLTTTNPSPIYVFFSTASTAPEYAVAGPSGAPLATSAVQLSPNTPYKLTATFTPDLVSVFNSSFTYTACEDSAGRICVQPQTIALTGAGVAGALTLTPDPIDFSGVPAGSSAQQAVTATNSGTAALIVSCLALKSQGASACGQSSPAVTLGAPDGGLPATLQPGGSFSFQVGYTAPAGTAPSDELDATYTTVGVSATAVATDPIQTATPTGPCALSVSPGSVFFNPVSVGNPVTQSVTLTNGGAVSCQVTGIAVDATSDPSYALAAGQATSLTVASGATAALAVTFDLNNGSPPATRRGLLDFQSTDAQHASVQVPLAATQASPYAGGGAWPRWHHDNLQSGLSPSDTSGLGGTVAWTFQVEPGSANQAGSSIWDSLGSPVVDANGNVYVMGTNGNLNAVSPSGSVLWKTQLYLQSNQNDTHPTTPIVVNDGSIFVAVGESKPYALFHVSAAGSLLDQLPPEGQGDGYDLPVSITNAGLILGGDDEAGAFAYTISGGGQFNLSASYTNLQLNFDQLSAVVGSDDSSYWCGGSDCVGLSSPGSGLAPLSGWGGGVSFSNGSATSDMALDEGFTGNLMLLLGGWQLLSGMSAANPGAQQLLSVSPQNGQVVWTFDLPAPAQSQWPTPYYLGANDATVGNSCPAIGPDGTIYVGNFDGLHAVDGATGQEKSGFPFSTNADDVITAPAIGADGTVFFGTAGGVFYAIHPDGTLRFKLSAGGRIAGSPAIGPSGAVYFKADDGQLYAVN